MNCFRNCRHRAVDEKIWFMAPHSVPSWNQVLDWLRIVNSMKDILNAA